MPALLPASLPEGFHPLRVLRVVDETPDAKSFVFEVPAALRAQFVYQAGQFLTVAVPWEGKVLKRCYSLASSPVTENEHKVTVKRVADGRGSNWLNDGVRAGDVVGVLAPSGRFLLSHGDGPLVLFAGGSGITPIISIIKTALATTKREIALLYANRNTPSIIFKSELDALVMKHSDRLRVHHRLDDASGFLTAAEVATWFRAGAHYYLCGPSVFMDVIEAALSAKGAPQDHVHVERFISAPDPDRVPAPAAPVGGDVPTQVSIELENVKKDVPYKKGQTLLDAALEAGIDAPYSCKEGFCGTCAALLVEGKVTMDADDALTSDAKKRGLVLACQARPTTRACSIKFVEY